ncbi:MAG: glycoside hydrolase, partial [Actinomycetota bacterium]|nr:glycoside hydrolase [Actinomycetota bacterium]
RSWEEVSPYAAPARRHAVGLDPMLHVDPDTGRIFTADIQAVVGCSAMVSFSDDDGESWITSKVCGLTDHQNVFSGPPPAGGPAPIGYPNVVYYCAIDGGVLGAYGTMTSCVKSLDGGITWTRTGEPAFHDDPRIEGGGSLGINGHCTGATGHGFVDSEGRVYIPRGYCGNPWLAISEDEGRTWARVQVASNGMAYDKGSQLEEHEAAVAVDDEGNVYYAWADRRRLPFLAVSRDGGETWSKPMMIGPPGIKETSLPNMDVGAPGKIAVTYYGSTNAPGGKTPPGTGPGYESATWNAYTTITANALAKDPTFYTVAMNDPRQPLLWGGCGILRCGALYDFLDVDIAPDGTAWTALVDACPEAGRESCLDFGLGIVGRVTGGPRLR